MFNNLESIFGLFFQVIPMYFFFKIIFLLVLFLPQYNGASYIYEKILKDLFSKYEFVMYDAVINITKNINFPNTDELNTISNIKTLATTIIEKKLN